MSSMHGNTDYQHNPVGSPQETAEIAFSGFQLPDAYGEDRITLLAREPGWVYAYWEISEQTREAALADLSPDFRRRSRNVIRLLRYAPYSPSSRQTGQRILDLEVPHLAHSWHIEVDKETAAIVAVFGFLTPDGTLIEAARSRGVIVPSGRESDVTDEEWLTIEELYLGGPKGAGSSPLMWMERAGRRSLAKKLPSSPGVFSPGGSPSIWGEAQERKPFGLEVDTKLTVHGRTHPDAKVHISGEKIAVASDGTFSVKYSLGDTTLVLPIEAVSPDGQEKVRITPVVRRETF